MPERSLLLAVPLFIPIHQALAVVPTTETEKALIIPPSAVFVPLFSTILTFLPYLLIILLIRYVFSFFGKKAEKYIRDKKKSRRH